MLSYNTYLINYGSEHNLCTYLGSAVCGRAFLFPHSGQV